MKRAEIERIRKQLREYTPEALRSRRDFLALRLKQDPEIKNILIRAAKRITQLLQIGGLSPVRGRLLARIESQLHEEANLLHADFTKKFQEHVELAVSIGSQVNRTVTLDLLTNKVKVPRITKSGLEQMFVRANEQAVRASLERTNRGMKLSDRIWKTSNSISETMGHIVQDAVASGQDAVTTARALEQYVKADANVLTKHYPGLMERMQGRIPDNLSYQALRLARTETTAALGQGSIQSAQVSPSCYGIQYCLSPGHHIRDICDDLASHDEGLGRGVYAKDNPPPYPAHPNTMSYLIEVHQPTKDFVDDLIQWVEEPSSQPHIHQWYEDVYRPSQR